MNTMKWTVEDVMNTLLRKHYSRDEIEDMFCGHEELTAQELLEKSKFPIEDQLYLAVYKGSLPDDVVISLLHTAARRAVRNYVINCGIPEAEDWAEKWLAGDNTEELYEQGGKVWKIIDEKAIRTSSIDQYRIYSAAGWAIGAAKATLKPDCRTYSYSILDKAIRAAYKAGGTKEMDREYKRQRDDLLAIIKENTHENNE